MAVPPRLRRIRLGLALALVAALAIALPEAAAHGDEHAAQEQLEERGKKLLLGEFTAAQPGQLLVVPYTTGSLGCTGALAHPYRVAIGDGVGVMFAANETRVQVMIDGPPGMTGYAGFAVDTHDATRALLMMQENAVALHGLVGVVAASGANGTTYEAETGALGVPYPLGDAPHGGHGTGDERIMHLAHDGSFGTPHWCAAEPGHSTLAVDRSDLPDSLRPGSVVHVVVLVDQRLEQFLPRNIDSTQVFEANLYLARPGEEPSAIRATFDPSPSVQDALPVLALLAGMFWAGRWR